MQSIEQSFNQDLNGDGRLGPVTTNVETVGSTTLAAVADSYFLYAHNTIIGPQLRYLGAYAAAGQFGAWAAFAAEQTASGYQVAWRNGGADQYLVWNTDSSGNWLSQTGVMSGFSATMELLEPSFHQDLNGDGVTGAVTTTVESAGATTLLKVGINYLFGGLAGPQLKISGGSVAVGQFGAWTPLGAEQAGSNYQVVWKNGSADQYLVWTTDGNGNFLSQGAVLSGTSLALESLETTFNQNFNGDGTTGVVTTVIESFGVTTLAQVANTYSLYAHNTIIGPQLKLSGAAVTVGQFGAWTPLAVEQAVSNYQIVWKNGGADQYVVWTTDSNGNFLSQGAVLSGTSLALESLEPTFGQDLNGNSAIGVVAAGIESVGATDLVRLANTYSLNAHGAPTGQQLKLSGAAVTVGQFGAWTPLGAEQTGSNDQIVWKNGGADQYVVWTTDSNGNFLSQGAVLSGTSLALESLETTFHQDFNSDGTTGVVTSVMKSFGATTLDQVANTYSLYAHNTIIGPQLKISGAAVTVGQFGAWTPLGAEQVAGGGYQVAWKNGGNDQYVVWNTDSSGNYLSQSAVVSGSSPTVRSLKSGFNQDLNGNGVIGSITLMTSSSESAAEVGPVSSGTLTLLTNYMASAFVPPAGQSAGAVAATQSSDQEFLTKPAA